VQGTIDFAASESGQRAKVPDERSIDTLLTRLYEVISFEVGGQPDWSAMRALFSLHARITHVTPEGIDYMNFDDFREMASGLLASGVFTSFWEYEVARSVRRFGAIAHVLSAYESKENRSAELPFARGINSLQLIREPDGWKVLSLLWDEERDDNPLALNELFGPESA
jgi:hypothetical protein